MKLRDREVIEKIRPELVAHALTLAEQSETFDIHVAAQTLLGLQTLAAVGPRRHGPAGGRGGAVALKRAVYLPLVPRG